SRTLCRGHCLANLCERAVLCGLRVLGPPCGAAHCPGKRLRGGFLMKDLWQYKGKRCLVVGCHSGIGAATARELVRLGAVVHGADMRPSPVEGLASFSVCDLRDR